MTIIYLLTCVLVLGGMLYLNWTPGERAYHDEEEDEYDGR